MSRGVTEMDDHSLSVSWICSSPWALDVYGSLYPFSSTHTLPDPFPLSEFSL